MERGDTHHDHQTRPQGRQYHCHCPRLRCDIRPQQSPPTGAGLTPREPTRPRSKCCGTISAPEASVSSVAGDGGMTMYAPPQYNYMSSKSSST